MRLCLCGEPGAEDEDRLLGSGALCFEGEEATDVGARAIGEDDRLIVTVSITMTLIHNESLAIYIYLRTGDVATYRGTLHLNRRYNWTIGRGEAIEP